MNIRKETINRIDYGDLEDFVLEKYPQITDYQFAVIEECSNDCCVKFNITGKIDKYDEDTVTEILEGSVPTWSNQVLLNLLCRDGHIEPGNYLVEVCW